MMILIVILLLVYINNTNAAPCTLSCSPGQYCLTTTTGGTGTSAATRRALTDTHTIAHDNDNGHAPAPVPIVIRNLLTTTYGPLDSFSCEACPPGQTSPGGSTDISQCTTTGNTMSFYNNNHYDKYHHI